MESGIFGWYRVITVSMQKIAIFCGGPSSEHEVSLNSAKTIYKFINKKKYEPYFFYISKDNNCKLLIAEDKIDFSTINPTSSIIKGLEDLRRKKMFALLAGIHGQFGEDGRLQVLLEYFSIPYSGSHFASSALAMDKYRSMLVVKNIEGIEVPKTFFYETSGTILPKISYPAFVKPNLLGSSVGVFKVNSDKELKSAIKHITDLNENEILIQKNIDGIEFSCGVLEDKKGITTLLPPIEIHPKKATTFDYASKYEVGGSEEITPPVSITKKESQKLSKITEKIHKALGCKVYSRSDFKIVNGKIYYLETNTLPGMTATSLLPQEAAAIGIKFDALLEFIINNSSNDKNN